MSKKQKNNVTEVSSGYQFGTFQGVFTPSILTILGVIMFLRFGWVLGNVGLPLTLLIVTMATSITFLTGLSLSATATNMKVGKGGAYFVISRSLGLEVGAAIGLPLFLAQALGIAFYISGFAESLVDVVDLSPWIEMLPEVFQGISEIRFISILTLVGLTALALISADLALKAQLLILCAILASLVSFYTGGPPEAAGVLPGVLVPPKVDFWVVFAVFFPAVTGIEAGIAMSGDLKNPAKSLPRGTIAAVLTGYVVYMTIPMVLMYFIRDERILLTRPLIMADIARWSVLILVGVWAATLSSALGSMLGAPRTLQALANDKVLPHFIGRGYGKNNDPRSATALSFCVALIAILLGDLNMIAPVLTMFFLTSYGLINLSAGLEGLIESPGWRPKFRFPWWGSLTGAAACFTTMLMIDIGATFAAMAVTGFLYYVMKTRRIRAHWGDLQYGVLMLLVRNALNRMIKRPPDERNWRPNVLAFTGSPQSRWYLVELAASLAQGPSYLTLATVVPPSIWSSEREKSLRMSIREFLNKRGVDAMIKLFPAEDLIQGAEALINGYGFGPLEPNIFVLGESRDPKNEERVYSLVRQVHLLRKNLVLVREHEMAEDQDENEIRRIDIWWRGGHHNIGLMLTIAHQMCGSGAWKNARVILKRLIQEEKEREEMEKHLLNLVGEQRLRMEVEITTMDGRTPFELIRESSEGADLMLMGFKPPDPEENVESYQSYCRGILNATEGMPVAFVLCSDEMDFGQIVGKK